MHLTVSEVLLTLHVAHVESWCCSGKTCPCRSPWLILIPVGLSVEVQAQFWLKGFQCEMFLTGVGVSWIFLLQLPFILASLSSLSQSKVSEFWTIVCWWVNWWDVRHCHLPVRSLIFIFMNVGMQDISSSHKMLKTWKQMCEWVCESMCLYNYNCIWIDVWETELTQKLSKAIELN